jgi:hypothetical protein
MLADLTAGTSPARLLVVCLACSTALLGCGGSNQNTNSSGPSSGLPDRSFNVQTDQPASGLHLSAADCAKLADQLGRRLRREVRSLPEPSPPLSRCRLLAAGVRVSVFLDAAYAARRRYENRMTEQAQFGAPDPAMVPHPVAGVGDPAPGEHFASWVPAYSTLFAVRGNRWLTVAYSIGGEPKASLRIGAAVLAHQAFRLSAG